MQVTKRLFVSSMVLLIIIVFTKEFIDLNSLVNIEIGLLVFMLITCLLLARGISLYLSLLGLMVGHYLWYRYGMSFDIWFDAITKNLPLAILFVAAPILSIPLREGGYLKAFNYYIGKNIKHTERLFGILSGFVFSLGAITNLGSVRVTHALIEDVKFPKKFLANIYAVGFAACITWSPYFGSVNLILYYTNVPFTDYLLYGFLYGVCLLILGNLVFSRDKNLKHQVQSIPKNENIIEDENDGKRVHKLMLNLVLLLVEVVIAEKFFTFSNMMLMVSFIAVIHSIIWSLLIKKIPEFLISIKRYSNVILQVKNEVIFFISAGFFGVIMANTPIKDFIFNLFQNISGLSTFVLIEFIIILTAVFSSIGIHQVITVTTLGLALEPSLLGFHNITFALTLIGGWLAAMIFSPLAPFNIVLSGLLSENTFKICLKHNIIFGIGLVLVSGIYIMLVNMWLM
ncbi:hypothetical protein SAMN00017405_2145 [Desulfonispora thiosulfatigenes DSM 11270]|uniref:Di-and tricarboxylate transporter n=1 Tax=Desulfonispora thiosulfatigenes DSM 11270 TaxID=656914 RepID=A0A1W1UKI6_DESTI|nr:hypothetical protein [Desulfonispora thiosulfatigenes]SMB81533.1 hypothetical protein SAMN00017405_2145 [Desulfonispora thiosulfatigenes DSM 11270]